MCSTSYQWTSVAPSSCVWPHCWRACRAEGRVPGPCESWRCDSHLFHIRTESVHTLRLPKVLKWNKLMLFWSDFLIWIFSLFFFNIANMGEETTGWGCTSSPLRLYQAQSYDISVTTEVEHIASLLQMLSIWKSLENRWWVFVQLPYIPLCK